MIDFIVIGAQRGGTQSFYDYLLQHPNVVPAIKPDIRFFDVHFDLGMKWYIQNFPLLSGYYGTQKLPGHITGEATPCYFHHPLVPERIKEHCPQTKMIVLLRNPVDRAYSHYRQAVRLGKETLNFSMALKVEAKRAEKGIQRIRENPLIYVERNLNHSYISHGMYAPQIRRWLAYFPKSQFLFLRSEEFFANPLPLVAQAYAFLGLPAYTPTPLPPPPPNFYEFLTDGTRARIDRFFHESNEEVYRLLGWPHAWEAAHELRSK